MAKAKTNKATTQPKKKPAAKPAAKTNKAVVAKPAAKPPLKELRPGSNMTLKKLKTITDKKGFSHFLLRYPFSFFLETEDCLSAIAADIARMACPLGYRDEHTQLRPFAILSTKTKDLLVAVETKIVPIPYEPPTTLPEPEPYMPPDNSVPVTGGDIVLDDYDRTPDADRAPKAAETKSELDEFEPVAAEVHSDDREAKATFDAQEWFKQASDDDILNLAREDYQFEATSDAVAEFMAAKDEKVKEVMEYVATRNDTLKSQNREQEGFGCSVDEAQAIDWVEKFRPHLLDKLAKIKDGEDAGDEAEVTV